MHLIDEIYGQTKNPFASISVSDIHKIMLSYEKLLQKLVDDKVLGKQCLANPAFRDVIRTAKSFVDMLKQTIKIHDLQVGEIRGAEEELQQCMRRTRPLEKEVARLEAKLVDVEEGIKLERKRSIEESKKRSEARVASFRKQVDGIRKDEKKRAHKEWIGRINMYSQKLELFKQRMNEQKNMISRLKETIVNDRNVYEKNIKKAWEYATRS